MRFRNLAATTACLIAFAAPALSQAAEYPQPLPVEPIPAVETLPAKYPASWIFVHDLHFKSILDGRAAVVDVAAENGNLKGQIPVAQFGSLTPSRTRSEIYVAETMYSRLTRGERTDVLTIWDAATLAPKGEIVLPGGKRGQFVTLKNTLQLTNDEKWALLFNFTPGASVSIIDLDERKILNEIQLPGCSLVYPTGPRGFMSLCADGTMTTIQLDASGNAAKTTSSKPFNDIDKDPMFMIPAMVGKTAWFATFQGNIRGIDLSGDVAKHLGQFSIAKPAGGTPEWRPGGWQVLTADASGKLYMLMNPNGREGSHKDGGTEVWVVDPLKKALVLRVALRHHSISVEATQQEKPLLVASRPDGFLDVYDATTGAFIREIGGTANDPMVMTAAH